MAGIGSRFWRLSLRSVLGFSVLICCVGLASMMALAEARANPENSSYYKEENESDLLSVLSFLWQKVLVGYSHVWPELKFSWQIVVGTVIAFFGAAFGSVGGVGGGGIFVPMLTLIIGFDAKSSTAISKCLTVNFGLSSTWYIPRTISASVGFSGMITGAAASTVYYNLKLRHPTLDMPIIDYDLALLFQPMLVLGISIGVAFNVIFADWMITVLLIFLFLVTSTKAFFKGLETWKRETIIMKEAARRLESNADSREEVEYRPLPGGPSNGGERQTRSRQQEVSILENVPWKKLGVLCAVWLMILSLQIGKNYSATCSMAYWLLNLLQIPVAVGVSSYEAVCLYNGRSKTEYDGESHRNWQVHRLVLYCLCGVLAGIVGGLLGLGGGFILGPLLLELGIPPQVSTATATFAMMFSASMSVVEYYLLNRFPVPYALYFVAVATVAAFVGQHVVRKLISILGRASLIIFILSFTIFVSAISLGGVGIANMVEKIEKQEYMGFENICSVHGI